MKKEQRQTIDAKPNMYLNYYINTNISTCEQFFFKVMEKICFTGRNIGFYVMVLIHIQFILLCGVVPSSYSE